MVPRNTNGAIMEITELGEHEEQPLLSQMRTPKAYTKASLFSRISYNWVGSLVKKAQRPHGLEQSDASILMPDEYNAAHLARQFDSTYIRVKMQQQASGRPASSGLFNITGKTILIIYWPTMIVHALLCALVMSTRLSSPIVLKTFLNWLISYYNGTAGPIWHGWLLAAALGCMGFMQAVTNHQMPWFGTCMGFRARQQAIAAVHAKALRLNSACIASVSTGHVVNLVSNDVRRFEDGLFFWVFGWSGPLELAMVLLMVSLDLGFLPALAGISATLLLIPLQAVLVKPVGAIRRATAMKTDERVKLASEAINGALAMKMLSWEDPLASALNDIRKGEAQSSARMMRIRATNMALQFVITPMVSFFTFAVYKAVNGHLDIAKVFYATSLLSLPRRTMSSFVQAVQSITEMRVSIQRIEKFLSMPEPPLAANSNIDNDVPVGYVSMNGADYDWSNPLGSPDKDTDAAAAVADKPMGQAAALAAAFNLPYVPSVAPKLDVAEASGVTLSGIRFELRPGELLGICGEVGAGKSSLLAALLGELQPLMKSSAGDATATGGPVMRGSIAYCSQVPWIMSGTVRDNITFGSRDSEPGWYQQVVAACALEQDIAGLVAGDQTELGERGVNLSGGQKARLALARACFSRAAIQLLDDPLSAVDPHVGRVLFDKCIGNEGLMQGCTRLLVTHQRQYLPRCDRVMVLRAGRVAAFGTWAEVSAMQLKELTAGAVQIELSVQDDDGHDPLDDLTAEAAEEAVATAVNTAESRSGSTSSQHTEDERTSVTGVTTTSGSTAAQVTVTVKEVVASAQRDGDSSAQSKRGVLGVEAPTRSKATGRSPASDSIEEGDEAAALIEDASEGELSGTRKLWRKLSFPATSFRLGSRLLPGNLFSSFKLRGDQEQQQAAAATAAAAKEGARAGKLVLAEERKVGTVSWRVYAQYAKHMGVGTTFAIAFFFLAGQGSYLGGDFWLSKWSRASNQDDNFWLAGYAVFVCCALVLGFVRSFLFFETTLRAATNVHNLMVQKLLRAPLSFFHTNPAGRILNRFSKDQGQVDEQLPNVTFDALQTGLLVAGALMLVSIALPLIIVAFIPLALLFSYIQAKYVATSRELKRWEAVTRSPVYAHFSNTIKGLPTIRAYAAQQRFHRELIHHLELNTEWAFAIAATGRWIGFRLDLISATTLMCAALLAMVFRDSVSPGVLALALTHLLSMTGIMQWFVRQSAEVESNMTCVERMLEYTELEQEPPRVGEGGSIPPTGWPRSGTLRYDNVTAVYRPGLPPVLRNITFQLQGGQSCGVVGRTGSGKSSLMLTLFRLIDVTSGTIYLDGVDTSKIGLDALRRQLAIIPQDPVLFSGTLRSNLDPWDNYDDAKLWEVLGAVQLKGAIDCAGGMHARMAEAGDNLSVGQRQLFCLARALLQDARVLALDEATANVDRATDALIQRTLRDFTRRHDSGSSGRPTASCRVLLVIAHRIDTIMDCDQLLVLNSGELVEQGPPNQLALQPGGVFARMVSAAKAAAAARGQHH